jgi:hypothetical protein
VEEGLSQLLGSMHTKIGDHSVLRTKRRALLWLRIMLYASMFQNIVVGLLQRADFLPFFLLQLMITAKDIILILSFGYMLFLKRAMPKLRIIDWIIVANIAVSLGFFFVNRVPWDVPLFAKVLDLRSIVEVSLIYFVGRMVFDSLEFEELFRGLVPGLVIIAVFGMAEWALISRNSLIAGYTKFMTLKGANAGDISFLQFDYVDYYGGHVIKRMMSVFLSPLTLAYFMIVPVSYLASAVLWKKGTNRTRYLLFLLVTVVILTLTRAVLIGFAIAFLIYLLLRERRLRAIAFLVIALGLVEIFFPVERIVSETYDMQDPSARAHAALLGTSFEAFQTNPWGYGLATAGPIAAFSAGGYGLGGESLYLTLGISRGLVGLAIFLLVPFYALIASRAIPGSVYRDALFISTITFMVASVPAEQWLGFQSSVLYWLFLGAAVTKSNRNRSDRVGGSVTVT